MPQREHADIVIAFRPNRSGDPAHLDADVILRDTLPHPDLSPLLDGTSSGPALVKREREWLLRIPGDLDPDHAAALEEAVWERMSFASHLRIRRLGEFTVGTDLLAPTPRAGPAARPLPRGHRAGRARHRRNAAAGGGAVPHRSDSASHT